MDSINYYKLFGGLISFILGVIVLINRLKSPIEQTEDINKDNFRGLVGSILAIVFGMVLILNSFG